MQPRNILFLHNPRRAPFSYGGIERVTLMLAEWFSRRGIGVYVIANAVDMEAIPEHQRSAAVWLPTPQRKMSYSDYCRYAGECCRKWDIDVVICQGGYLRRMEILRRMTDAPIVYCNHSQPFWEIVRSLAGYDRTHRHLTPLYLLSRAYKQWKTRRRVMRRYRSMYRSVDSYVLLCEGYVREFYDAMGAAAEAEGKAVAIYNPAAVPDALPDLSRKQRRLLFVGRLSYSDKRVDRLLQVWSRLQDEFADWSLDIVGVVRPCVDPVPDILLRRVGYGAYRSAAARGDTRGFRLLGRRSRDRRTLRRRAGRLLRPRCLCRCPAAPDVFRRGACAYRRGN